MSDSYAAVERRSHTNKQFDDHVTKGSAANTSFSFPDEAVISASRKQREGEPPWLWGLPDRATRLRSLPRDAFGWPKLGVAVPK